MRWSGQTRNWQLEEEVVLNPDQKENIETQNAAQENTLDRTGTLTNTEQCIFKFTF